LFSSVIDFGITM